MIDLDQSHIRCYKCRKSIISYELYTDASLGEFEILCEKDFYKKYRNRVSDYLEIVKDFIPEIESLEDFQEIQQKKITIDHVFSFPEDEYNHYSDEYKADLKDLALKQITGKKSRKKYNIENVTGKELDKDDNHIISIEFRVSFTSYLAYLEHKLNLKMLEEFVLHKKSNPDPILLN